MEKNKVTDIKYKQLDKDPEIKQHVSSMESIIFGDAGIGLMDSLGMNPGRIQKSLDEQLERKFDEVLKENKEFILKESRVRALPIYEEWLNDSLSHGQENTPNELSAKFIEILKEKEVEIIIELMDK